MIERFGTTSAQYGKPDERHYSVETEVEISDQFYGWLLGFGKRVKLVWPEEESEKFVAYIDKIREMY
jgi:predicted DNA-binding transcriptional regulator YafY